MKHKALLGIVPLLFAVACSTLSVDKTRTASMKRVAVAGFSVQQPASKGIESLLTGSHRQEGGVGWEPGLGEPNVLADEMYKGLEKQLHKSLKWTVSDRNAVAQNGYYRTFYDDKMKGFQSRPGAPAETKMLAANGIVDAWPVQILSSEKRRELIKKLGVDAIAIATVSIKLEKGGGLKMLVGAGDYFPVATVRFAVFDAKSDEPAWNDMNAVGEEVSEGVEYFLGVANQSALEKKMAVAAENSFQKLLIRYRDWNG